MYRFGNGVDGVSCPMHALFALDHGWAMVFALSFTACDRRAMTSKRVFNATVGLHQMSAKNQIETDDKTQLEWLSFQNENNIFESDYSSSTGICCPMRALMTQNDI